MVISEKYKTVFLRIPKNASTSLATFFIENCASPNDKYTGIGDAKINTQNIPNHIITKYKEQYRFIHLTLNELILENIISEQSAREKRVIGVLRDPIERQLSLFFYKHRTAKSLATPEKFRSEFRSGYHATDKSNHILQTDYTKIGEEQRGEFWLYDNLECHLNNYVKENNIEVKSDLKSFKSNFKPRNENLIQEYYDTKTMDAVKEYYARDIELHEELKNENR